MCIKKSKSNCCNSLVLFLISILFLPNIAKSQSTNDSSITYIHKTKISTKAKVATTLARCFFPKNRTHRKLSRDQYTSKASAIPKQLFKEFNIDTIQIHNRNVYSISSKGGKSKKHVLYLHGGGYVNNIFRQQWKVAAIIVRKTNCTFIVPDYPLTPTYSHEDAFAMLDALYLRLLTKVSSKDILFMGDSAGGGLALALAQKQRNEGTPSSSQLILICPWLDITLSNPQIKEYEKKDPVLRAKCFVLVPKFWSGKSTPDHYLLSPINGSLEGLPKISLFIGTHDILYPDCQKFRSLMKQKNISINYFEYPKMFHDWVFFTPIAESKVAIEQICKLIVE